MTLKKTSKKIRMAEASWRGRSAAVLPCLLLCWASGALAKETPKDAFYLKNGDRVVFYGDSITEQRLYTSFAETYIVTRFPKLNVTFVHSGVGGDRVGGGWMGPIDPRLDRDAIPYKPTAMTIMLGMNDASYKPFDQPTFDTYAAGYRHILDKMKAADPGVRFTLIEPSPFDDVTRKPGWDPGYNSVLLKYSDFVKQLAASQKQNVADLNGPVVAMLEKANAADAAGAQKIIPDRVHPAPGGHLIMAEGLLKAWNAPSLVAGVTIDAAGKRASGTNTAVSGLAFSGGMLTWTQTDSALPFPLDTKDETLMLAVRSSDFVAALDNEPLMVTGLASGSYTLKIDGEPVGTFTTDQLKAGINLALLPTPMLKQAQAVHALTWKHNDIHSLRWRSVDFPFLGDKSPGVRKALDGLDALEADVVRQQHAAAQPKPHKFALSPQ